MSVGWKNKFRELVLLIVPFLLWMVLFRAFLAGTVSFNVDTNCVYAMFKYFFNNLFNGVVPLWQPFVYGGIPYIFVFAAGILNPLAFAVALLHFTGIDYYQIFTIYLLVCFGLGVTGFYLLSREIFDDKLYALVAYWLLLFSGMGAMLFNQVYLVFVFVPAVWFFYFLLNFLRRYRKSDFTGMSLMGVIMIFSDYPFYFIVLFGAFLFWATGVFPRTFLCCSQNLMRFLRREWKLALLLLGAMVLFLTPHVLLQVSHSGGDVLFLSRHDWDPKALESLQSAQLSILEAGGQGSLGERMAGGRFLAHLDKYHYAVDSVIYIPIMAYLLILLSVFTDFDRRRFLLLAVTVTLFLVSLGMASPLYEGLFQHIFFFKFFRNLFFFSAFLIPLVILFAVAQFRALTKQLSSIIPGQKGLAFFFVVLLHAGLFLFLNFQGSVLISSYLTAAGSFLIALFFIGGFFQARMGLLALALMGLCLLEPSEVFGHYRLSAAAFEYPLPKAQDHPSFFYVRPAESEDQRYLLYQYYPSAQAFWYDMTLKDSNGFNARAPIVISKGVRLLWEYWHERNVYRYLHDKIRIYDRVQSAGDDQEGMKAFEEVFIKNGNLAFVAVDDPDSLRSIPDPDSGSVQQAMSVTADSEVFKVLNFDVNSVRFFSDFPRRKFLVYNDAYHKHWQAFINGRPVKLYRANMAFKGVWLPAGRNDILFRYSPPGGSGIYLMILIGQIGMLGYWGYCYVQEHRRVCG